MPRTAPYIPPRDSDFATWAANFSTLLTANPAIYGQTSGTASAIAGLQATWAAAYAVITSPSTRTPAAIIAKDTAKVNLLASLRPVAVNISLNPAVTSGNKIAIGVNPRTTTPSPVTPPTTYPILSVQAGAALQLYLRYRDSAASPSVKSKPYGVSSVQLFWATSATPITDVADLTNQFTLTKSPFLAQFDSAQGGLQCYMAAYYLLANGGVSGYGPIINFTIPKAG